MATRNHYGVLGVPRTESTAGIRAAFRDLVKRYRPDRAGDEDTKRFGEVVGAYRVLADPGVRRAYDEHLGRQEQGEALRIRWGQPVAGGGVKPEPLAPQPLDVYGAPEEAARGGVLPIRFPLFGPCASCRGSEHTMLFPCLDCGDTGIVDTSATVRIRIPPSVPSGSRVTALLSEIGIHKWSSRSGSASGARSPGRGACCPAGRPLDGRRGVLTWWT